MRFDLHPEGDVSSYLILDPAACPDLLEKQGPSVAILQEEIARGVKTGKILAYNNFWRKGVCLRIYVDEVPPPSNVQVEPMDPNPNLVANGPLRPQLGTGPCLAIE